jgi:hypothetical protein
MRKKVINKNQVYQSVKIKTEVKQVETWDTIEFDNISIEEVIKQFKVFYPGHVENITALAMSRIALGTALTNVGKYVSEYTNESIDLDEEGDVTNAFDEIFTSALMLYVTEHAISLAVSEDSKDHIMKHIEPQIKKLSSAIRKSGSDGGGHLGTLSRGSEQHEKNVNKIAKKTGLDKNDGTGPYGNNKDFDSKEEEHNKDGRLKKVNQPSAVIKRGKQ